MTVMGGTAVAQPSVQGEGMFARHDAIHTEDVSAVCCVIQGRPVSLQLDTHVRKQSKSCCLSLRLSSLSMGVPSYRVLCYA